MPKQNRKPGIHLHKTKRFGFKIAKGARKPVGAMQSQYYWILIAKNGKTIAKSSETYKTKRSAVKSISIAGKLFYESAGAIGYNFYDHSSGGFQPDFVPF